MPTPVYAYFGYYTDGQWQDSYVGASGGSGVWSTQTNDASHAVAYSYFMYLLEGELHFLEAMLDHASYDAHQSPGGGSVQSVAAGYAIRGLLLAGDNAYASLSIPTGIYAGLNGIWKPSNQRAIGLAINRLGMAAGVVPADHVAHNYFQKWLAQIGDWIGGSLQYMPADQKAFGAFYPKSWWDGIPGQGQIPPWFMGITALGAYNTFRLTEDTRFCDLGDCAANLPIGIFASGRNYVADTYHAGDRPHAADWNATTNQFYGPGNAPVFNLSAVVTDHANGIITMDLGEGGGQNQAGGWLPAENGDQWSVSSYSGNVPAELTEATVYYLQNVTINASNPNCTFKVSTTSNGAPITFSANSSNAFMTQWWPQAAVVAVAANPPYMPPADTYANINAAAVEMAKTCGNAAVTSTILTNKRAFIAPIAVQNWMPWGLKAS